MLLRDPGEAFGTTLPSVMSSEFYHKQRYLHCLELDTLQSVISHRYAPAQRAHSWNNVHVLLSFIGSTRGYPSLTECPNTHVIAVSPPHHTQL